MTTLLRTVFLFIVTAAFGAGTARAAPMPDPTFAGGGIVRIGVASGYDETATASAIQADGRIVVAGTSVGRQSLAFVTRFRTDGTLDSAFGARGPLLLTPPAGYFWTTPIQVAPQADGSLYVVGILYNGFTLMRITANGTLDPAFGTNGITVVSDGDAFRGNSSDAPVQLAVQPDGKLLVVTDASANGAFTLRFRRFLPNGTLDASFGAGGEKLLANLPVNFAFTSARLAVAEPNGGFTLAATATFTGGTWLLLRTTPDGTADTTLGTTGFLSGFDLGNPRDQPTALVRRTGGGYALIGYARTAEGAPTGDDTLLVVAANGTPVAAFGNNGRVLLPGSAGASRTLTALSDGGIATAQSTAEGKVRVTRLDASGNAVTTFGIGGVTTLAAADYRAFLPIGLHADGNGQLTAAGWGYASIVISGALAVPKGLDVLLGGLTANGAPRPGFGSAGFGSAGIAVWNNPAFSSDRIDAIRFDHLGRIVLAGFSNGSGTFDYLLSRLTPDGALDTTYASAGRLNPQQYARFTGIARAVQQPDEAIVVAGGDAFGSFGAIRAVTMFRASAAGVVDAAYKPGAAAAGPNATVALGVRPDGRIVYGGSNAAGAYILQQFLASGTPDPAFGNNGRVDFPSEVNDSQVQADLAVLADGAVVFAVFSSQSLRLYKVNANGTPVLSFGTGGVLVTPTADLARSFVSPPPTLLALADGTFLAAVAVTVGASAPSPEHSLFVLRATADGRTISTARLLPDHDAYPSWALAALPDSSVVIARAPGNSATPTAALYRLLPDDQFDASFGANRAYPLAGIASVTAMRVDPDGRLVIAGQDAAGALVTRLRLDATVAGVPVVEFYNVDLRHYFMTANGAEMHSIDTGGAGPGWQRTGRSFAAYVPEIGVPVGALPVCRFYGTPGSGPNSHFYTVDPAECAAVKRDRGWTYEGIAFFAYLPQAGQCAAGTTPIYRAYNNRFAQNDSNHRYATDPALLEVLRLQGWSLEGVVLCAAG